MKKIFVLLITLLFISGCSINYDLEFKDELIIENTYAVMPNEEYSKRFNDEKYDGGVIHKDFNIEAFYGKDIMHKRSDIKEGNNTRVSFKYDYDYSNFVDSYAVKACFKNYDIVNNSDEYIINLTGPFYCNVENVNVNFITDKKVVSHNADVVKGNKYTWNLSNKDYKNISIKFHLLKNEEDKSKTSDSNNSKFIKNIIYLIIVTILIVGSIIYLNKTKKSKEF